MASNAPGEAALGRDGRKNVDRGPRAAADADAGSGFQTRPRGTVWK
jgi:hypothetical protein